MNFAAQRLVDPTTEMPESHSGTCCLVPRGNRAGRVSVVVMEQGSRWPGQVGDFDDVVALSHDDDDALVRRTREKLAALRAASHSVRLAVLACNAGYSESDLERRASLARPLLAAVAEASFGRLVLSADARASRSLRTELLELVSTLTRELGRGRPTVSVHFTEARP
jgi:hypothetical protein